MIGSRSNRSAPADQTNVARFYTNVVLVALADRLDQAFPEFGWRRDSRGWVATNEEHTHARLGVRADRVVAHGPAPRGFLVHGGEPMLWTAYVGTGEPPRGEDFVRAVKELAGRAGIDPDPIERARPRDRRTDLLQGFIELCRRELASDRGVPARDYLGGRGLPEQAIQRSGIGLVPKPDKTRHALKRIGYREAEIAAAGVVSDSRWPGRVCGAWMNEYRRPGTLWARSLDDSSGEGSRYLYLRGASRTNLPPYGFSDLLPGSGDLRRDLVLVEGIFDLHQLRAHGVQNVAAVGGVGIAPRTFELLSRLGVERVTLCLDRDQPGRDAINRAVEHSTRARRSPSVLVIDPDRLTPAKDPDEYVREGGIAAWDALAAARSCGITWRALELATDVTADSPPEMRREALARAGAWLGTVPPRLALEQEDAVAAVAERCGYSSAAVWRVFRARFWSSERDLRVSHSLEFR